MTRDFSFVICKDLEHQRKRRLDKKGMYMKIQISRETTGLGAKGGRSALNLGIELIIIHKEQKILQRMRALGNLNETQGSHFSNGSHCSNIFLDISV